MKKLKKTTVAVLVITFFFSPILAVPVRAQWVVIDPANLAVNTAAGPVKEFGLDSLAWMIVNLIIERIAASTVNWINSGFKGSPAYVTDPEAYFTNMGDQLAAQYIFSNPNLNFLCGPISAKIRLALTNSYNNQNNRQWQCTLTDVAGNMEDFMGDFEKGGWDKFFEMTQRQQNNPIGAYLQAQNEMSLQIATRQGVAQKELDWGQGFMSWKECQQYGPSIAARTITTGNGQTVNIPASPGVCIKETTNTPGSVIESKLNDVLGSGQGKLQAADEINEIVSALLNQLVSAIVGGIGKGLRGMSSPSPANNNQVFTNQLSNSTATSTADYFGNIQDTSTLDTPIPDPNAGKPINAQPVWP